jgi:anti-sigma factor RsiW
MHELLHAYFDDELADPDRTAFEEHLTRCPECARELEAQSELRVALQDQELRFQPPATLAARIQASLQPTVRTPVERRRGPLWMAAAIVLGISLIGIGLVLNARAPSLEDRLAQETTASHARALQAEHLLDIASTNRHRVKPWFQGKLDFAPLVVDLTEQGFPLAGGRLDYVDDRPAAALVYHRREHVINLFIWPATKAGDAEIRTTARRGYSLCYWSKEGLQFWAVSDLNIDELREFANHVRTSS